MAKVSIGVRPRLCGAEGFTVLGFRRPWGYSEEEIRLIREAPVVYYPTSFYADILAAMGKPTFPGPATYRLLGDKLKQSALFRLLGLPHPRTAAYPPARWGDIPRDFPFPFVAKLPHTSRGSGVFLVRGEGDLAAYLTRLTKGGRRSQPAYIQEYLSLERDLRVVCLNRRPVHAYWRERAGDDFRTNVSLGARISFEGVPQEALQFAQEVAERCGLDEVGLDLCEHGGGFLVLEANMAFGLKGFEAAGLDYRKIVKQILESDEIELRLLRGGQNGLQQVRRQAGHPQKVTRG
jgi:ribosomal protein S6--L-glutamate ligase